MRWHGKNRGKHPLDPEYIDDYDAEEDYENWLDEQEHKFEYERENN